MTWQERAHLALKEELTVKEISQLLDVGLRRARDKRKALLEHCLVNDIKLPSERKSPTSLLLELEGKDINYYLEKARLERKLLWLKQKEKRAIATMQSLFY